jgi:hypothetical protein
MASGSFVPGDLGCIGLPISLARVPCVMHFLQLPIPSQDALTATRGIEPEQQRPHLFRPQRDAGHTTFSLPTDANFR